MHTLHERPSVRYERMDQESLELRDERAQQDLGVLSPEMPRPD
ncbi:hypothetical protein [Mumia zhuanghuii]|nr:hypothetical protein [Mumia zhuanghuii]